MFILITALHVSLTLLVSTFAWMPYDLLCNIVFCRRGSSPWLRGQGGGIPPHPPPQLAQRLWGQALSIASLYTRAGVSKVPPEPQTAGWAPSRPPTPMTLSHDSLKQKLAKRQETKTPGQQPAP